MWLLGVFALLGVLWLTVPADGVPVGPLTLRFASYQRTLRDARETKVDVDSVLQAVQSRFRMESDTLQYYHDFFYTNPDRIYLPADNYRFFDPLFRQMEQADGQDRVVRVAHYGDSQLEMDRISQDLREALQDRFGGIGTGFFPVIGNVCMDQCMIDLNDIPDAMIGDEAVLIGQQGERMISVEEVAASWGTINYEVTCGIAHRVNRFYS